MRFRKTILTSLLIILFFSVGKTAHIIGGEISSVCQGNGNYTITIKMYRDCNGGGALFDSQPFAAVGQVTVYNGSNTFPFQSVILGAPVVTPLDENVSNQCLSNVPNLCVEEGVYTFDINLPPSPESYHITYQRCCRNQTISNIIDPDLTGATFTLEISPKSQAACNSGPYFNDYPPIVICVNEPLMYDHSATDTEADSLVYEFCSPLRGGTQDDVAPSPDAAPPYLPVDFIMPTYSAANPLAGNPIVSIDPITGLITGTPTNIGQYVVGVCVKEYRDGELIGLIQRDFQFNVTICNFTVDAELDGVSTDGQHFVYENCGALNFSMLNESFDQANISNYLWTFSTAGITPTSSTGVNLDVELSGPGTYEGMMILNAGSSCTDTAFISIHSYPETEIDIDYVYEPCGAGPVQFVPSSNIPMDSIVSWSWDFGDGTSSTLSEPQHQYATTGEYLVGLSIVDVHACVYTFEQWLNWEAEPELNLHAAVDGITPDGEHFKYTLCGNLALDMINESTDANEIDNYLWEFSTPGISPLSAASSNISIELAAAGTYEGMMIVNPGNDCNSDTAFITIEAFPPVDIAIDYQYDPCENGSVYFIPVNTASEATVVAWSWNFGDGGTSQEALPAHHYSAPGSYPVSLHVIDLYGCTYSFTEQVEWMPELALFLEDPPVFAGCAPLEIELSYLNILLDDTYMVSWDLGTGDTTNEMNVQHEYTTPGIYNLNLQVQSAEGCEYIFNYPGWVTVTEPPIADFSYAPNPVNKKELIEFEDFSSNAFTWFWEIEEETIEEQNPEHVFETAGIYDVQLMVYDEYGCSDSLTQSIEVRPVFNVYVPNAFSPNDDGVNDIFKAYTSCPIYEFQLKVFDRWGAQIFESDDIEEGWNGFRQNEGYDPGVFVWVITYEVDDRVRMLKGDVSLVK